MYRILLLLFLCPFGLTVAQQAISDAKYMEDLKGKINAASDKVSTISSDFIQEKEMSILNDKIISTGKFMFKKEKSLRWEYVHPFSYTITIHGDVISIRDEGKVTSFNTATNRVFEEVNKLIVGSVNGTLLNDQSFSTSYAQDQDHYIITLIPLSMPLKESLVRITLYFARPDLTVSKLELAERGGDFTRITFTKKQLNQPIADEVFILR